MMIFSILTSILFFKLNHPLSMGLALIVQTIFVSLITGNLIKSFWYSYIFIIIMLSGMLVLFIYMASIASNEKFKLSIKMTMTLILGGVTMMIVSFMNYNKHFSYKELINKSTMMYDQTSSLMKLFNYNIGITMLLVLYLLITMIAVSYIVNLAEGPLQMKN